MKKTLLLSARYSEDSINLRSAAADAGYDIIRLQQWRAPEFLDPEHVIVYGEVVFVLAMADQLSLGILEPTSDLLPQIPFDYLRREVRSVTYAEAQLLTSPLFLKPAAEKFFTAGVYKTGADLPPREALYSNLT
ncbi:MAG: ATP-grasp domain-containing protein, partial [Leptospirales bacterium]|nr:ATP-grasp domain-containing protein [Leptospirales bacterium]